MVGFRSGLHPGRTVPIVPVRDSLYVDRSQQVQRMRALKERKEKLISSIIVENYNLQYFLIINF